jgi:hypothetical protein
VPYDVETLPVRRRRRRRVEDSGPDVVAAHGGSVQQDFAELESYREGGES